MDSFLDPETVSKIKNMSQLYDIKDEVQFTSDMNGTPIVVVGTSYWSQMKINGTPGVVVSKTLVNNFGYKIGSPITSKINRWR